MNKEEDEDYDPNRNLKKIMLAVILVTAVVAIYVITIDVFIESDVIYEEKCDELTNLLNERSTVTHVNASKSNCIKHINQTDSET